MFGLTKASSMPEFQTVARVDEIPEGEGQAFTVNGRTIAVFNDRGAFRAIDDRCPHAGAPLSHGSLVEGTVICAWHGWRFHLCDGSWADYSKIKIGVYPVRVVGDEIQVKVPDAPPPVSQ
jgi:nitrite reductase (NADH) small subunit/3-phenylpropionate/trans-cinnamate dioxygenase ferredoxin subunit